MAIRSSTTPVRAEGLWQRHDVISAYLYWTIHAGCLAAFLLPVTSFEIALCLGLFWIRLFGITGGYHRYFSHKTFKTSRPFQFALAVGCYAVDGLPGLVWGFCISTTLLWHATYSINSLAHRWGSQRYETGDDSRNNAFLALLTLGEGWHNNHHHYMASARQGFFWWEIDITYYVLRGFQAVGLVWDIREPPAQVVQPSKSAESSRLAA